MRLNAAQSLKLSLATHDRRWNGAAILNDLTKLTIHEKTKQQVNNRVALVNTTEKNNLWKIKTNRRHEAKTAFISANKEKYCMNNRWN